LVLLQQPEAGRQTPLYALIAADPELTLDDEQFVIMADSNGDTIRYPIVLWKGAPAKQLTTRSSRNSSEQQRALWKALIGALVGAIVVCAVTGCHLERKGW
jgi:hypothetical protein